VVLLAGIEITPPAGNVTSYQIIVTIPASVPAGTQTVQVTQRVLLGSTPTSPPVGVPHRIVESDVATFVLRWQIQCVSPTAVTWAGRNPSSGTLNLRVHPAVALNQQVRVLLNQIAPVSSPPQATVPAYSFVVPPRINLQNPTSAPPPPTNNLTVPFAGVLAGSYLVRAVVDGAESPLSTDAHGNYNAPQRTTPPPR